MSIASSPSSTATMPNAAPHRTLESAPSGRRMPMRNKDFLNKHGHRHHSVDPEKAPYPLSYDRHVLELESMELSVFLYVVKSVSIAPFTSTGPPSRSLDLGCGGGTWVLEAAKQWPDCYFVGFDLVDVQLPLSLLPLEIARRITWLHGNFLTTKLPFDDDEFDFVRMNNLGKGIPENKWGVLLEEVHRVLSPGGVVEVIEQDIIFPTLPSWFTAPLHVRNKRSDSIHHPNSMHQREETPPPSSGDTKPLPHDHALLESLYYGVFANRFINLRPTAVLPIHFTSTFRHVISGPIIHLRMPVIPPLQALPQPLPTNALLLGGDGDRSESACQPITQPCSVSFSSSADSRRTSQSTSTERSSLFERSYPISDATTQLTSNCGDPPSPNLAPTGPCTKMPLFFLDSSSAENTTGSESDSFLLTPLDEFNKLNESSLAMQLYYSYQSVLACQESMWEELVDRMRNRPSELTELGWESDLELSELESRARFEVLVERYKRDMQARVSLWCSLADQGWPVPPREPLSKAELVEEERLHNAMLEARRFASAEDVQSYCRSLRVLVGTKSC